ncbi:hypothetical protein [Alphaproteobacteria bacterium endosymbiont of Tiliacea citrago]|uniref:hypothetical protein n=1 Tax=Alphaproteobacteria bacterium endosymbiont of Tiliacea citrago TaxID=3077944 RepID=UPI00313B97D7
MILETRIVCPISWKYLCLLKEYQIEFNQSAITLKDEVLNDIKTPKIDQKEAATFFFSNLDSFVNVEDRDLLGTTIELIEGYFINQIILPIRNERIIQPLIFRATPNIENLNKLQSKSHEFLIKTSKTLENKEWINNKNFSYLDISLGSAIATLDYLGEIQWKEKALNFLYIWYLKVKSKPCFEIILKEICPGLKPFVSFNKLDF